jgi:DNA-binding response OmpR family regulator
MKPHILIVESDEDILDLLTCRLSLLEESYAIVKSAKEAKAYLKSCCPSWVILSLKLPDQNGLPLIRLIKKMRPSPPRVVVYSTQDDVNTAQIAYTLGADEFVSKMEPVSHLLDMVFQKA